MVFLGTRWRMADRREAETQFAIWEMDLPG